MGNVGSCLCCECCNCCCPAKKSSKEVRGSLKSAQTRTRTVTGKRVNRHIYKHFLSRAELEQLKLTHKKKDSLFSEIFSRPLNDFTEITENLYLTGMGGISKENITAKDIKCIVNATYELPKFVVNSVDSYRIPVSFQCFSLILWSVLIPKVEDSYSEDLYPFFKDLSHKIEDNNKKKIKTVIYCMGGVSRSPTLVMGIKV